MNAEAIISKIQSAVQRAYNSHNRGQHSCYRNRLGIDELTIANAMLTPLYITTVARELYQRFNYYTDPNTAMSTATVAFKQHIPNNCMSVSYSGDNPVNITATLNSLIEGTIFSTRNKGTGVGEYVKIINYRTKEQLENDMKIVEEQGAFARADKAIEIFLTATPYTTVRLFENRKEYGTVRLLLVHSLSSEVIHRIRTLLYTDQCADFATNDPTLKELTKFLLEHADELLRTVPYSKDVLEPIIRTFLMDKINEMVARIEAARKEELKQVLKKLPEASLSQKREECERAGRRYKEAVAAMTDYERSYIEKCNAYENAKHKESEMQKNLEAFFNALGNKLQYVGISGDYINIIADTTLQYFDKKKLEPYKNNPRSVLREAPQYVQHLIEEVFETRTAIIHITAGFRMHMLTGSLEVIRAGAVSNNLYTENNRTGLPNPHHEHYNCFGENYEICRRLVSDGKLDEALMTIYAATGGLNISDTAVFNSFVTDITNHLCEQVAYIEKNGKLMTINEYKEAYEKEQEE